MRLTDEEKIILATAIEFAKAYESHYHMVEHIEDDYFMIQQELKNLCGLIDDFDRTSEKLKKRYFKMYDL